MAFSVAGGMALVAPEAVETEVMHNPVSASSTTRNVLNGDSNTWGFNIDGVGGNDLSFFAGNYRTADSVVFVYGTDFGKIIADTTPYYFALNLTGAGSTMVSESALFATNANLYYNLSDQHYGHFSASQTGYIGVQFQGDTGSNGTQYAWMKIHFDYDIGNPPYQLTMTVLEWAYDNSGAAIKVGDTGAAAVPEPATSTLLLLALGAAGVYEYRRRKKVHFKALKEEKKGAA